MYAIELGRSDAALYLATECGISAALKALKNLNRNGAGNGYIFPIPPHFGGGRLKRDALILRDRIRTMVAFQHGRLHHGETGVPCPFVNVIKVSN